jgi:conjugative transposon TraM protein
MKTKTHAPQFLQKRKFFVRLPLLVLPFITLLFWALGGGKVNNAQAGQPTAAGRLNVYLPDANLKEDKALDKLSYYEKAASDSVKLKELMKNDPYYHQRQRAAMGLDPGADTAMSSIQFGQGASLQRNDLNPSPHSSPTGLDTNEAKVYQKLQALNTALHEVTVRPGIASASRDGYRQDKPGVNSADLDRLEQMIGITKNVDGNEDPEMEQLNGMMEKILDIQHPERVKEKIKQTSEAKEGRVFAVKANPGTVSISLLTNGNGTAAHEPLDNNQPSANGFFSIDDEAYTTEQENAINAVVHETQTIVDGAIVKLRLMNAVYINGTLIPKDHFVFGKASLIGERLNISITSVRHKNSLFPVQIAVLDMDGIDGIYVPGAITRDVAKGSVERAVQGIDINTLNPSLGAQAASAGVEAAKTLLSRKAKLVKVTLKAGYQVLLRDEK